MESLQLEFKRVYDLYHVDLLRFIAFRIQNAQTAEDVTATVFLKYWEKVRAGMTIEQPRAFLYHLARACIIDEYRKQNRTKTLVVEEFLEEMFTTESLLTVKNREADYAELLCKIRSLKDEYREVIFLHYVDNFTISEIAVMLETAENTIRVRLHRALARLRKVLR